MKELLNSKYSKIDNNSIKTFRNSNIYGKNLMNNEEYSSNDINTIYRNKSNLLNRLLDNGKENKSYNNPESTHIVSIHFLKNYKKGARDISNNINNGNNHINNKFYLKEKKYNEESLNSPSKNISENNMKEIVLIKEALRGNKTEDLFRDVPRGKHRTMNKSKSYFVDTITLTKDNQKNTYKNINTFNKRSKNKKYLRDNIFSVYQKRQKKYLADIYFDKEKEFSDRINIKDLMEKVNYEGEENNFIQYLEELKLQSDITNTVQNMFKIEINGYEALDKLMREHYMNKNKKILDMYKYLFERLIQINQHKIKEKEIEEFNREIFYSKQGINN